MTSVYKSNLWSQFIEISKSSPENISFAFHNKNYSFSKTLERALQLSQSLLYLGMKKGDVVGIFHDKSFDGFCLMLACLRIGTPYVNFDSNTPAERLKKILKICSPSVIFNFITELDISGEIVQCRDKLLTIDELKVPPDQLVVPTVTGTNPAYLMFTSGSTGMPKAAVVSHGALLNFINWSKERFEVKSSDRFTNVNPLYFDNSVFDFYASIFNGAALCPAPTNLLKKPLELVEWANALTCTIWFSVPSLLVYLLTMRAISQDNTMKSVRSVIFGGEGFPKNKLLKLFEIFSTQAELVNVYGPTEGTCICSAHTVTKQDFAAMDKLTTLGKLAANFDYFIEPTEGDPNRGELILLGPQVCLGYYNSPEQTSSAFIQNPKHSNHRDIGYKTGDMVELDNNGNFHFLGRKDFQIKHMGHRIELEEIEAAVASIEKIDESAVSYEKLNDGMGRILLHFKGSPELKDSTIIDNLKSKIPSYMLPQKIIRHDQLPKNANGKIDRRALLV
jgi:D-alanine--poly(phosphoribitol) ligase subunit 1